jgi:hypothetical protein
MTWQIPAYGRHFQHVSVNYSYYMANHKYELKADPEYYTRSDRTYKFWYTFGPRGLFGDEPATSLTNAMSAILEHLATLHKHPCAVCADAAASSGSRARRIVVADELLTARPAVSES